MSSSKFDWLLSSLTPNESQVPSTAEIIQKCLSVNPFDLKFREANLQINGGSQFSVADQHLNNLAGNIPTTSGCSALNLPSSLSSTTHSPGIFSNINVLTADIEGELRKHIDLSRKVQQLRENGLLSKQDDGHQLKTPCTSDVLNAVLDMSAAHQLGGGINTGQSSPFISSSSFIAGLSGLKAALHQQQNSHGVEIVDSTTSGSQEQQLMPANSIPNFKLEIADSGGSNSSTGICEPSSSSSFIPVGAQGKTMSTPDLHTNTSATTMLTVSGFKQLSPVLPAEAMMVFQQHRAMDASSDCSTTLVVPSSHQTISAQSSPLSSMRNAISPAQVLNGGSSFAELTLAGASPLKTDENGCCKLAGSKSSIAFPPQITIAQQNSPYSSKSPESIDQRFFTNEHSDGGNGRTVKKSKHSHSSDAGKEKHSRKYTKHNIGATGGSSSGERDSQVSSTRGSRGRRSAINDMPPDERRQTILERNKAAAVRYRKRKKEEHDDMIVRVHEIEQEKNALETQNSVLRRELERLTFLIQERESRCVCKANQLQIGMSIIGVGNGGNGTDMDIGRSPSVASTAGGSNNYLNHPQQMRPGSTHSVQ